MLATAQVAQRRSSDTDENFLATPSPTHPRRGLVHPPRSCAKLPVWHPRAELRGSPIPPWRSRSRGGAHFSRLPSPHSTRARHGCSLHLRGLSTEGRRWGWRQDAVANILRAALQRGVTTATGGTSSVLRCSPWWSGLGSRGRGHEFIGPRAMRFRPSFPQLPQPPPEIVGEDHGRLAGNRLGSLRAQ
jgi:hypothetical protein